LFWRSSEGYQLVLQFVVFAGALLVAWDAYGSARQLWAIGFVTIALIFNPFQPWRFSRELFLWLDVLSIATFLVSLAVLKAKPKLPMPSATY
jgi:hypothetical protein